MLLCGAGSEGEAGVQSKTSISVSQPRCLVNGVVGHVPRKVAVSFLDCDNMVRFCEGNCMIVGFRGIDAARAVFSKTKSGSIWAIIVEEDLGMWD